MKKYFSISQIDTDKKRFLQLLLIGDESENMIDRYLEHGTLFVGFLNDIPIAVCVITDESESKEPCRASRLSKERFQKSAYQAYRVALHR